MKKRVSYAAAVITLGFATLAATAVAQAAASGPYYATPSWDQQMPAATRFIVLSNWGSAAVLDRETGLVWERTPSAGVFSFEGIVLAAHEHCINASTGGRFGWKLPSIQELSTLLDPSISSGVRLPVGHPFQGIGEDVFWSSTNNVAHTGAWRVPFSTSGGGATPGIATLGLRVWCVRGGSGTEDQGS